MDDRELLLKVAWHFLGTPYIWGGDDPSGFDCSGFAIECLQSVGILPRRGDWAAGGLYDMFKKGRRDWISEYKPGDLVFWKGAESDAIIHVEIVVDSERSIGASGGGSAVLTASDAWRKNSYIKIRPFATRPNLAGVLNPFHYRESVASGPSTTGGPRNV